MTESQTNSEAPVEASADIEATAIQSADPARQAELDALAAELQGNAPVKKPVRKSRRVTVKDPNEIETPVSQPEVAADASEAEPAAEPVKKTTRAAAAKRGTKAAPAEAEDAPADKTSTDETPDDEAEAEATQAPAGRSRSTRSRTTKGEVASADADATETADGASQADADADGDDSDGDSADGEQGEGSGRSRSRRGRSRSRSGNGSSNGNGTSSADGQPQAASSDADDDRNGTANRGRDRGRKRGTGRLGDDLEPEILPDDVLLPIAGILDVLDNYAFVRTTGYLAGFTDVYVSLGQVKKYGLRKGDAVVGAIRQPRDGEQQGRQKYNALVKVDSVNGLTAEASIARTEFTAFTPVRPSVTLTGVYGKGQRALILGASGAGKTKAIASLAADVSDAHPESHLMVILVGPRPEEITEFRRVVKGEVVISGLELSAEDHVTVVELAVERAKRLVELGIDVVVLIDSITQLGRAYATLAPASRGLLDDPSIALSAKRLLGAARATEEGASLTIVATASAETALDQLVTTELADVANATVQL